MLTGGDAEDEALLLWSLVVEDESITESILIVHPLFANKKKIYIHFPHYESLLQTDIHTLQNHGHSSHLSKPMLTYPTLTIVTAAQGTVHLQQGTKCCRLIGMYVCLSN